MTSDNPFRKKCAIPYYGGKFRMARHIACLVESLEPLMYCEPFCGGSSVLFAVPRNMRRVEIVNDMNSCLVTTYKMMKRKPKTLFRRIKETPYSLSEFQRAKLLITQENQDPIDIAWATYVVLSMAFQYDMNKGGWGTSKTPGAILPRVWQNRKDGFMSICNRLENVFIDSMNAVDCIERWDHPNTLFYVDPPYLNTDFGTYGSANKNISPHIFNAENMEALHQCLDNIKGRYILSGYETNGHPKSASMVFTMEQMKRKGTKQPKKSIEFIWVKCEKTERAKISEMMIARGFTRQ